MPFFKESWEEKPQFSFRANAQYECFSLLFHIDEYFTHPTPFGHPCYRYTVVEAAVNIYEGWNFNSGNYLFTTDTK